MQELSPLKLNLLHLSDIHFSRGESDVYDPDSDLRNELERDVERLWRAKLERIDGILVTGDIAFAGHKDEFDIASAWLEKLCDFLGCARDDVWTVPGNHDVDRRVIDDSETLRTYHEKLRGTIDIDGQIRAYMRDTIAQRVLFEAITHYNNFAARFDCDFKAARPYWEQDKILNDGSTLRLRGLNTTLISSRSDDTAANKLILGSIQSTPRTIDGVTYLTLCHHPPQWLRDEDQVNQNLDTRVRVHLFGHKHKQNLQLINNSVRIIAGAVHPNRREPNWQPRYNLISLSVSGVGDDRKLDIVVYLRVWSNDENVFKADYDVNGSEERSYALKLETWYPPTQNSQAISAERPTGSPDLSINVEQDTTEAISPQTQESKLMNKARRLAYRFYSLPYDARIDVVQRLHLIREDDEGLQGNELFNRLLHRAKEEDKLSQLWDVVQEAHGDRLYSHNPFREENAE